MRAWISRIAIALAICVVVGGIAVAWHVTRPLNVAVVDPAVNCPSSAASAGIESYLSDPRNKLQAARVLVRVGQLYDERGIPPPLYVRIADYHRAQYVTERMSDAEMARLLCSLPIIDVRGSRRAGIPSVANAVLNRNIDEISASEMSLIACGVLNTRPGARRAMVEAPDAGSVLTNLSTICEPADH